MGDDFWYKESGTRVWYGRFFQPSLLDPSVGALATFRTGLTAFVTNTSHMSPPLARTPRRVGLVPLDPRGKR